MANNKKNKKKPTPKPSTQTMSPKQYFLAGRPRALEIHECLINADWQIKGLATILIARKHKTGNITFASFIVDIFCLGLKDANSAFNRFEEDYNEYRDAIFGNNMNDEVLITYDLAHNIIFGAIEYAKNLGFSPYKDWEFSQFMLEPKSSLSVEKIAVEFGKDGKPFFISGPYDKVDSVISKLEKAVGEGNFTFMSGMPNSGFNFLNSPFSKYDEDDEEEDDNDENETEDTDFEEVK